MNDTSTTNEMADNARKIIMLQLGVGLVVAAGFFLKDGSLEAMSAFYGAFVSVISATMLSRGIMSAGRKAAENAKTSQAILYLGAAVRFILVLALFGIALGVLELAPLPVIAGFVITQLIFVLAAGRQGRAPQ